MIEIYLREKRICVNSFCAGLHHDVEPAKPCVSMLSAARCALCTPRPHTNSVMCTWRMSQSLPSTASFFLPSAFYIFSYLRMLCTSNSSCKWACSHKRITRALFRAPSRPSIQLPPNDGRQHVWRENNFIKRREKKNRFYYKRSHILWTDWWHTVTTTLQYGHLFTSPMTVNSLSVAVSWI